MTFVTTDLGERYSVNAGHPTFSDVPGALDYFHVQAGRDIDAAASGTTFSVAVVAGAVTIHCTQGEVNVLKTGYLRIGLRRIKASLTDVISATRNPTVIYHPTETWYLASFSDFAQAQAYYEQQLTAARRAGDANAIASALSNIGLVQADQGQYATVLPSFQQIENSATSCLPTLMPCPGRVLDTSVQGAHRYANALQSYRRALA